MIFQRKYLDLTLLVVLNLGTEIVIVIAAKAQLTPDTTLGGENSIVTPTNNLPRPTAPSIPIPTPGSPPPGSNPPPGAPPPTSMPDILPALPLYLQQFLIEGGAARVRESFS